MSYDAWGKLRNPATQAIYAPGSEPELFLGRGYTGHEHLAVFGLINMNARLYDPALGRFLSPDPYVQNPDFSQNFNRYSYCLNNPLIYVDQNGEWFLIDDLIAAAIGGIFNVIVNAVQGNIHSVGQGFALFGTGAASGFVTIYAGPIAGAAVLGATNSIVNQGFNNGWGNIDWMQVGSSGIMGGATSYLGGNLGSYFAKPISKLTEGIASPILKEVLTQGTLNSATGFGLGTALALGSGADLGEALKQGSQSAALGLMSGIMNGTAKGYQTARQNKISPWNGEPTEGHHSDPKFMGGDPKQDLTPMSKSRHKQLHKDSIRANKRIWWSILGGPSYTPEASFGVGGAVLASFRLNKNDTISQRSFIPAGFNITLNGTFVFAGAGTLFFNENRFRIYISYGYRNEPSHYFGKGYETIEQIEKSDSTTKFHKSSFQLYPRFVWEVRPHLYTGPLFDINFSKSDDINPVMAEDPYFNKFKRDYVNIGVGGLIQYDTRNDVATPSSGMLLSAIAKVYGKYLGGAYNYEMFELEYRQFRQVFKRRSTLAWTAKTQIGMDNVPYSELPNFGNPFDLRGYAWGKYRDKSMAYGIIEYRHMFMSQEAYARGAFWSKFGGVAWIGTGTIGKTPADWDKWKLNYGIGLRIQLQPRKNFRLDIGKEPGQKWGIYMNMTEAF